MVRALGREIRWLAVGVVAAAVAVGGTLAVWAWMGDQLIAMVGGQ